MNKIAVARLLFTYNCSLNSADFQPANLRACIILTTFFYHTLGKLDVLDYLINELGVDPIARDKSGMSCVHAATQGGQPNAIKVAPIS